MDKLKEYMNYYIDTIAHQNEVHCLAVLQEPRNAASYSNLITSLDEITYEKSVGWGKPDKVIGCIELRYLWKQFKPKTFQEWLQA